jgi:cytochrome P450
MNFSAAIAEAEVRISCGILSSRHDHAKGARPRKRVGDAPGCGRHGVQAGGLAAHSINIRFDPDRFSPEAKQVRPAFSYFAFGRGGRWCLGESFAELEGLLTLATLASKVHLRLVDGQTILPDPPMTLRPKVPVNMTIESVGTPKRHPTTA